MKNEELLEKWEEVVKRVRHDGNKWRATKHSFICSKHFEKDDYIQPPTADAVSCRLKRNAITSLFKIEPFPCHISEEEKTTANRMQQNTSMHRAETSQAAGHPAVSKSAHKQKV